MSPSVPDQGRYSGDADRRGDDRTLKILLVRPRLIGDVIFTTPLIGALRRAFPGSQLTYVVESAAEPVVRHHPSIDEIVVLHRRRGTRRLGNDIRTALHLRRARFDVVIDLHGGPRSAWLAWASGAPRRIGYRIKGRSWMYTDVVERDPEPSARHSVLNQWELLRPLGIEGPPQPAETPVEMAQDPEAAGRVTTWLSDMGIDERSEIVAVHVSASNPFKRWPAASFVELIVELLRNHSSRVAVVLSGPSEPDAAREIATAASRALGEGGHRVIAPQFNLQELRALIERSAVYIGGDSGPLHVAATTLTPIVELLGPTLASRSFPWRSPAHFAETVDAGPLPCRPCNERVCAPGDFRCLTHLPHGRVAAAAERAMASGHKRISA